MAGSAIVIGALALPGEFRQAATSVRMALKATVAVIGCFFFNCRQPMWVMAGNAAELAFASLPAAAFVHLLDLAYKSVFGRPACRPRPP